MWCSMRFAANAEGIRTKGRSVAWQPLTRRTEEQKDRRTEDDVRVSRLPREHKNISYIRNTPGRCAADGHGLTSGWPKKHIKTAVVPFKAEKMIDYSEYYE